MLWTGHGRNPVDYPGMLDVLCIILGFYHFLFVSEFQGVCPAVLISRHESREGNPMFEKLHINEI
jgi:uncharacterized membrane protein